MATLPIDALITELRGLYLPPCGAPATWKRIALVLRQLRDKGGAATTAELSPPSVGRWLAASTHLAPMTARTYLGALRRACVYAVHRGYLDASPFDFRSLAEWARGIDRPGDRRVRACRHHPIESIVRVLRHLAEGSRSGWEAHRLYALASAAFLTGARAREVQAARAEDFDLGAGIFRVEPNERRRLKTRNSRRAVVLPPELLEVLASWLPECGSRWAFPAKLRLTPWTGGPYGDRPIDRLKEAGRACGVEGFTFLSLRHSYVTHSRTLWGIPPKLTQQLCGHTEPETTEGYTGFDLDNARTSIATIAIGIGISPRAARIA